MRGKKGLRWVDSWGEVATITLLIVGLVVSLLVDSALVSYIVILLSGLGVGRLYDARRHRLGFCFWLIVAGYLAGYIIGNIFNRRGHWLVILILFYIGIKLGEYLHRNKFFK